MLICVKCLKGLSCEENGVIVAVNSASVKFADWYKCPECGAGVLTGAGGYVSVELARKLYNREEGQDRTLFKMDKGTVETAKGVDSEITVYDR